MVTVLITGGSGFIGSNLAHRLSKSKNNIELFVRSNSDLWRLNGLTSKINIHQVDILKKKELNSKINTIKPDIVYHCATYGVQNFQKDFYKMMNINCIGTYNLLESLLKYDNAKKIINVGSSFEYGMQSNSFKENHLSIPTTLYGISKNNQTNIAQYFAKHQNLPVITFRVFSAYGKYDAPGKLMADMMYALINKTKMKLAEKNTIRDFIYIDDVIDALILGMKTNVPYGEIFNIGTGMGHTVYQMFDEIQKITKNTINVSWNNKDRMRDFDKIKSKNVANIDKIKNILKWIPNNSFKMGINKTYKWYVENIDLYK